MLQGEVHPNCQSLYWFLVLEKMQDGESMMAIEDRMLKMRDVAIVRNIDLTSQLNRINTRISQCRTPNLIKKYKTEKKNAIGFFVDRKRFRAKKGARPRFFPEG